MGAQGEVGTEGAVVAMGAAMLEANVGEGERVVVGVAVAGMVGD